VELRAELEIDAPPERVWGVLSDFSAYHEWNPYITGIAGELRQGSELAITVSPPGGNDTVYRPRVLVCDEPRELRWRSQLWMKGLFDGEQFFLCQETPSGGTRFVHGENFTGFFVRFLGQQLLQVARGFAFMNQALKERVETGRRVARE